MYIAEESTLAILPVCCCSTCRLWPRDNHEEDGGDDHGTRGQHVRRRRKYVGYTTCLLLFHMQAMVEGQRRGRWRRDVRTTCTSPKKVRCLYYLSVVVSHAGYGGGTTLRRMVATTTGREDNMYIAEECTLAILPVCCCSTCRLWRRDNHEEDGGDNHGTRGQHVHRRRKYVGYTTCLLLFHMQATVPSGGTATRKMAKGREENMYIAEESTLAILPVFYVDFSSDFSTVLSCPDNYGYVLCLLCLTTGSVG